jgi:hypothetical protein
MDRRTFFASGVAITILAACVRLHNALAVFVISGYDAFAHFTYIWFLADTGRVPLANAGWEFFQPPLYYAVMAAIWRSFDGMDPVLRLRVGMVPMAMLGLAQAAVAFAIVRRRFPRDYLVQLLATGLMLFLPMHLYSAGFLGNENLNGALGAVALLLAVRTVERATVARAALARDGRPSAAATRRRGQTDERGLPSLWQAANPPP